MDGELIEGSKPTKEIPLHLAMYRSRPETNAVVHLHSPYAVAVSTLDDVDPLNVIPPLTAYYVMRVGKLPLVPYLRPGHPSLGEAVLTHAADAACCLLANHGPVASATSLEAALDAVEEIEQTARIWLQVRALPLRPLNEEQQLELRRIFGASTHSGTAEEDR
jgi:ribulose-5-phosphate 4-epimerase/fuculose-1-phosphate aldolase